MKTNTTSTEPETVQSPAESPTELGATPCSPLSARQLEVMQHALGLDQHGQPPEGYRGCSDDDFPGCYRNRYVTHSDSPDGMECEAMVALGLMAKPRQPGFIGDMTNYFVTRSGYEAVKKCSPLPPKLSKAKQRWRDYLATDGVFPNFRAYLHHLAISQRTA